MKKSLLALTLLSSSVSALAVEYRDDENVSVMKGQLVEVGERNKYHYNAPKFNLDINPFGIMAGLYSASASFALGKIANIRGDVSYNEDDSTWEIALGSQIYFRKMYSGTFLEPGLLRRESDNVFGPQVLLGYTWIWDSGMNVSLAAGVGRNLNDNDDNDDTYDSKDTFANGYFRVGYAF